MGLGLCDFDYIFLHCTKLFIRQSIDREKIFDVTFNPPPLKNPAYATVSNHLLHLMHKLEITLLIPPSPPTNFK